MFAVILDQKSPVVVRWLPHRGHRSMEASLVELSVKTCLSRDELVLCQFEAQVYDEILRREPASTSSAALLRGESC